METKKNIYEKLLVIQKAICGLGKDKKAMSYSYVTGDKLLGFIKPIMNEQGLLLKQEIISIDNVRQDYKVGIGTPNEKPKSEINSKVMMKFTWVDSETGEKDENLFGANGQNDWDKGVGSALTYGERYFLLKFFHIETDKDDIEMIVREGSEVVVQTEKKPFTPSKEISSNKTLTQKDIEKWNGKIYKNNMVYIDNVPYNIPTEQIEKLKLLPNYKPETKLSTVITKEECTSKNPQSYINDDNNWKS